MKKRSLLMAVLISGGMLVSGTSWAAANGAVEASKAGAGQIVTGKEVDKTFKKGIPAAQKSGRQGEVDLISVKPKANAPKAKTGKKVDVQLAPRKRVDGQGKAPGMKQGEVVPLPGAGAKREAQSAGKVGSGKQVEVKIVPGEPIDKTKTVPALFQKGMQPAAKQGQGYVGQGRPAEK